MTLAHDALTTFLKRQGSALGEPRHLRYSSDLDPEACERAIVYRLSGAPRDPTKLGDELRFHGGRIFERTLLDALRAAGHETHTQVPVRPLRPSAWAWATGHADLVLVKEKRLLEVKAPRSNAFEWAGSDPTALVREGYRWQLSAYFNELKAQGLVETAAWVFLDREGSHLPVEVELEGRLLVASEKIAEQEALRSLLVFRAQDGRIPPRIQREVSVSVLKTRGHAMTATSKLNWRCSYCPFRETCRPGAETAFHELTDAERARVLVEAKDRWAKGDQRVSVKLPPIPNDDDETSTNGAPRTPNEAAPPRAGEPEESPHIPRSPTSVSGATGAASSLSESEGVPW